MDECLGRVIWPKSAKSGKIIFLPVTANAMFFLLDQGFWFAGVDWLKGE
jgi:hypothetical protein